MWFLGDQLLTENTLLTTNTYKVIAFNHQDMGACASNPYFVSVTVNSPPSPPSAPAQQVVLAGATISSLAATPPSGCSVQWFTSASGGYPLPSGTILANGKYYAGSKINTSGCTSTSRTLVNVTIDHYIAPIATSTSNYIHQITPQVEIDISTLRSALTGGSAIQTLKKGDIASAIQYYDKLGRPSQLVNFASSPTGKDVIQVTAYDNFGRESTKYLPYTNQATGGYRIYASAEQQNFYLNTSSDVVVDAYPFAKLIYESMPGGRVVEQGAPGAPWQPYSSSITGSGHTVKSNYTFNNTNEVIYWQVENNELKYNNFYVANELRLSEFFDEDSNRTREYKDKYDRLVLRSVSLDQNTEAKTYYVYDDYGQLRYVLSPMFIQNMGLTKQFLPNHSLVKEFAYYYMYDTRGRLVVKQLPGAEPVYMVYDQRDRLVVTQDGNMRPDKKWLFTKYDALNRPVLTGVYTHSNSLSQEQMQTVVNDFYAVTTNKLFEEEGTAVLGYTNKSFPLVSTLTSYISVTYYDGYNAITTANGFAGLGFSSSHNISGYVDTDGTTNGYFDHVKGQVTGQRVKVLDGNEHTTSAKWLSTVTYYDNKYRVIQTVRNTYPSGTEYASSKYSFANLVLETRVYQSLGTATQRNVNTYDHAGRLTKTVQTVSKGSATKTETLAEHQYNELGQLKTKKVANGVQQMDHAYNIRGWLKSINNISSTPTNARQFALSLQYETNSMGALPQYNGNISAMQWRSPGGTGAISTSIQGYAYAYDGMNRMLTATYAQGATGTVNKNLYNESVGGYDLNGNILSLTRRKAGVVEDNLTYTYQGNRLTSVNDAANDNVLFTEVSQSGVEYQYDANGNMVTDLNRALQVEYNMLNLPRKVTSGADYVRYIYDAAGAKLAQITYSGGATETTNYLGGFIYSGTALDFILTGEGRAVFSSATNTFAYEYHLKDHLGNTRVATASSGVVTTSSFYYPFGLTLKEINAQGSNPYLYNGKELQDASLNGVQLGWYDFGARFYDPTIARWSAHDPLAEKNRRWSPFAYAYNNPIRFIDPDGRNPIDYDFGDARDLVDSFTISGGQGGESFSFSSSGELSAVKVKVGNRTITVLVNSDGKAFNERGKEIGRMDGDGNLVMGGGDGSTSQGEPQGGGGDGSSLGVFSRFIGLASSLVERSAINALSENVRSFKVDPSIGIVKSIGAGVRYVGWVGIATSSIFNINAVVNNPTWGNYGRFGVSGLSIGLSLAFPGPGTLVGFGITTLDAAGQLNPFYNFLDDNQTLYREHNFIILPSGTALKF
jgi:RHS repeat-associated protein